MQINLKTEAVVAEKIKAIKQVYHDWGFVLRRALKSMSPKDTGALRASMRFRVTPRGKTDITSTVKLIVGVLDTNSPVLKYLHYIVNGAEPHFVPIEDRHGNQTGILGWAIRHDLVYYGTSSKGKGEVTWRWNEGANEGKKFSGLTVNHSGNDMFNKIYRSYHAQINSDIREILRSK